MIFTLLFMTAQERRVKALDELAPTTNLTVTLSWHDHNDQDGKQPASVKVQLYANSQKSGDQVTLTKNMKWQYTWINLPMTENDQSVIYSLQEETPSGYHVSYKKSSQDHFTITNMHQFALTSLHGHLEWDDQNNQEGVRPKCLTVQLLADGIICQSAIVSAKSHYLYTFDHLPLYDQGKKIVYSMTKRSVPGYKTVIDGYNIVHTRIPKKTDVRITLQWNDHHNHDHIRLEKIQVQLYGNGQKYGKPMTVTNASQWIYTFSGLPVMKKGKKIVYTVKELDLPQGYSAMYYRNRIIVNTHKVLIKAHTKVKRANSTPMFQYFMAFPLGLVWPLYIYTRYKKKGLKYGRKYLSV